MKQLFLFFIFSLLSVNSFAQTRESQAKLEFLQKIASYNGAVVGNAQQCGANSLEYKLVEDLFYINLNRSNLNNIQQENMRLVYLDVVKKTLTKPISKPECKIFMLEFNKIVQAIQQANQEPMKNN